MILFVIIACTVLHNICLEKLDENIEEYILEGQENEIHIQDLVVNEGGVAKRNYLITLI